MSIALLGVADDPEIEALAGRLRERVDVRVWDVEGWPGETPLSIRQRRDGTDLTVGDGVDVDDLDAVFVDRLGAEVRDGRFAEPLAERPYSLLNQLREYRGVLLSTLQVLEERGVRVVNPTATRELHLRKPWQLATLADAGLPVPETLTTNDPDAVRTFVDEVDDVIYKPVTGGGYARPLDEQALDDRLDRLANAPVQFQERLSGDSFRLYVVDGELVAAGRLVTDGDVLDYRSESHDVEQETVRPEIERATVEAAEALDLTFAGIDVVADDDEFAFLEANPAPMFVTFDDEAGTDVAGALADSLSS